MSQQFRPLVISGGVQKRIPDGQALEVGSVGIVAKDGDVVQKLQIGHAENVDEKPIELLGSAHFKKNVKIDGELTVVGDSTIVDSLVSQTIFNESVQFGDAAGDIAKFIGIADFDGSIDADVTSVEMLSSGLVDIAGINKTSSVSLSAIDATQFADQAAMNAAPGTVEGELAYDVDQNTYYKWDAAGTSWVSADSAEVLAQTAQLLLQNLDSTVLLRGQGGVSLQDAVATLKLDGSGNLTDTGDELASIALDPTGAISLDADASSNFNTSAGDLTLDAEAGSVLINGGEPVADAVKLHASNTAGGVQVQAGTAGISLQDSVATLKLDGSGNLTDTGDELASIALNPANQISLHAGSTIDIRTVDPLDANNVSYLSINHHAQSNLALMQDFVVQSKGSLQLWANLDPSDNSSNLSAQATKDILLSVGTDRAIILGSADGDSFDPAVASSGHARIRNVTDPEADQDVVTKKYMEENGGGTIKLLMAEHLAVEDLVSLDSNGRLQRADADDSARHYAIGLVQKLDDASYQGSVADEAARDAVPSPAAGDKYFVESLGAFQAWDGLAWATVADADRPDALVRMLGKFTLSAAHGQTPGAPIYMADVPGSTTHLAPSAEGNMVQRVGFYLGGSDIMLMIGEPVIL